MGSGFSGKYHGTWSSPEGEELRRRVLEAIERAGGFLVGDSAVQLAEALVRIAAGESPDEVDFPEMSDVALDLALDVLSAFVPGGPAVTRSLALAAKAGRGAQRAKVAGKAAKVSRHPHARDAVPSEYGGKLSKPGVFESEKKAEMVREKFKLGPTGNIGYKGNGEREFKSDDPYRDAEELFEILCDGANEIENLPSGKGIIAKFSDGACVTFRWETKSSGNPPVIDSPAVDIRNSTSRFFKDQRVHFEEW